MEAIGKRLFGESAAADLQTSCSFRLAREECVESFMEQVSTAKQPRPPLQPKEQRKACDAVVQERRLQARPDLTNLLQ